MTKIEKLMEILEQVQELYPELDKVVVDNVDSPSYFVVASTEYLDDMSELLGLSLVDEMAEVFLDEPEEEEFPPIPKKKGNLH